jgi:hypothetical protein
MREVHRKQIGECYRNAKPITMNMTLGGDGVLHRFDGPVRASHRTTHNGGPGGGWKKKGPLGASVGGTIPVGSVPSRLMSPILVESPGFAQRSAILMTGAPWSKELTKGLPKVLGKLN